MDPKELIARRVAQELRNNTLVNLGIGLPTLVASYVPPGLEVYSQRTASSVSGRATLEAWRTCI